MGKMVPKIRFKGFNDKLELHRFDGLFKLSQGLQIPINKRYTKPGKNRYFYITNEFIKDNCETSYFIDSPSTSVICEKDDILMTRTGNTGVVVTDIEGCFHNNFFKIKYDKENLSKKYICYLLSTNKMHNIILNSAGSSTIPDLSHKAFYEIEGYFAKDIKEQKKIGDFLSCIDKMIDDVVSKLDKLKEIKKTMLYKMFPQNGEKVPEIRLKGFEGEWKEKKLGKILQYEQPNKYIVNSTEYSDEYLIPVLTAGNTFILGYINENFGIKKANEDEPVIIFDDFMTTSHFVNFDFKVKSSALKILYITDNSIYDDYFSYLILNNIKYVVQNHERHWISFFSKMDVLIPEYKEQKAIGEYFNRYDNMINEYTQKITKLKELKKTLLNKMFV